MRNIFKKSLVFFCLLFCLSCLNVKASETYTIDKYNIDIIVNEDNTFDIKETIRANFNIPQHGIFRTIPLKNNDKISNVKVNEEFSTSTEDGNYVIKIGSADKTLTGLKEYEISYIYDIGNDESEGFDEFYYNLIGTGWDTSISNVSFKVTMPKEFDETKLGFSAGLYGASGTPDVSYQVDGNVITGTFNRTLSPGEGLTVRLELPDGYFEKREYTIDKFDIDIKVNEDNTFDIKENIRANFNIPKHGIFRTIPLRNEGMRADETSYKNKARITKVKVNENFSTSKENDNYVIKIGDANRTLIGVKDYEISYHYNVGNDKTKNYDELYYNLIGTDWDTTISNISFRISMPKEFDETKLGFSAGELGSSGTTDVSYQVNDNVITGTFNAKIYPGKALTVRLELPDGYFVKQKVNVFEYLIYILPIIFLGISILLWYLYGRDDQVVETIEFYPPEGKNSLEVGFMYKGKAGQEDVTSLLIYLANKGYIKIQEEGKKGFKITKVKDYDGNNYEEKLFLNGLFKNSSKTKDGIEFVTDNDLYDSFYVTMNSILRSANSSENKNAIFEKSASNKTFIIILMIIATFCIITIPPFIEDGELDLLMFALIFPGIGFTLMFQFLISDQVVYVNGQATKSKIVAKVFGFIFGLLFGGFPWLFLVYPVLSQNIIYLVMYIIGVICVFGMLVSLKYLPKRTPYGNEILGKLKGFKTFLETAEKEKLEAMVKDNPTYFYDILPFTYVLGVSSTWISKFETINMEAPTWYYGPDAFDIIRFNSFMDNTMNVAAKSMTSTPSSSSDGGFSGGGFSGGGFSGGGFSGGGSGGGGGGSW